MKHISTNQDYKAASNALTDLRNARESALAEQRKLEAQLQAPPEEKPSALKQAWAMLANTAPPPREDPAGLELRLADCRQRLALLEAAIAEQQGVMHRLTGELGVQVNRAAAPRHVDAVRAIKDALDALRKAREAERGLREGITSAGYACSLESMAHPEIDFTDLESPAAKFAKDVQGFLAEVELRDKAKATVHILCGGSAGNPGDVVVLPGTDAATLVRHGHAELSNEKPRRIKPQVQNYSEIVHEYQD
jgi:hypothetical protein